jgi:adenylylsulfate kinase
MTRYEARTDTPTGSLNRDDRERLLGQRGCVVWLTGLSASGKTTIANSLERRLLNQGFLSYVLDGDTVRRGLCRDLGFSEEDRHENIRRIGEVAALMADAGVLVIVAFISPYKQDRDRARGTAGKGRFVEVYVNAPLEVCEQRDPKQLYRKARAGLIPEFTGISSPYEPPDAAEIVVDTSMAALSSCVESVEVFLKKHGFIG